MAFVTSTVLAVAAITAAVAGTGVAIYGQRQAANAAQQTADYNSRLATQQALQNDMNTRENVNRQRINNARALSTQRSQFASAGVTLEGTPLEVQAQTAGILELKTQEYNRQSQNNSAQIRAGGAAQQMYGQAQAAAYNTAATGSLLSGIGNASGQAYQYGQSGAL